MLIQADLGVATAAKLTANLAKEKFDKEITGEEIREAFAADIAGMLEPVAVPLVHRPDHRPHIILVVGVNGVGKTTTIGKLAKQFRDRGLNVMLAAGDTFQAAAVEQLQVWGQRTGAPVVTKPQGSDAAALAFEAIDRAHQSEEMDILIDTAGRLHNRSELMDELNKIRRVIAKKDETAPQDTLLVLDATTGQNAHQQVRIFQEMAEVSGLVLTKLDGTARGGLLWPWPIRPASQFTLLGSVKVLKILGPLNPPLLPRPHGAGLDSGIPPSGLVKGGNSLRSRTEFQWRSAQMTVGKAMSSQGISSQENSRASSVSSPAL